MTLRTLADLVDGLAERGDAPAIVALTDGDAETWGARQLGEQVSGLARGLPDQGVAAGDAVALLGPNRPAWITALLGIARAGAIAVPLSDDSSGEEVERLLRHSRCRHLVTSAKRLARLPEEVAGSLQTVILLDEAGPGEVRLGSRCRRLKEVVSDRGDLPELRPEQVAALLYTSGTTGTPKGVPLTHDNLCSNVEALLQAGLAGANDRVLLPLPLHHIYPLTVGVLGPLAVGAAIVLPAGITGPQIMRALQQGRCTIMIAVPRLYEAMLQGIEARIGGRSKLARSLFQALLKVSVAARRRSGLHLGRTLFAPLRRRLGPSLRLLASGGARLEPQTAWRLEGLGFEVLTGYGLTETAPIVTFNRPGRARLETAGQPLQGVELRIEPAESVSEGQGEVLVRGPNLFAGYLDNPEATEAAFTADGFFRTGDLGALDDDGNLRIVGRSKELIVLAGGKNIFPDEVEQVYGASAIVREVAVLEDEGRLVGLFVPEADALRGQSSEDFHTRLRGEIERLSPSVPSYARIGDFALTGQALPRTQIGKLRRHELPALFEQAKAGREKERPAPALDEADQELIESPPGDRLWPWLEERFEGRTLTLDTSPQLDLGLDSFDWMSLAMELEERFGVRLDEEALARITSLRDLLEEARAAPGSTTGAGEPGRLSPEQERWLEPRGSGTRALGAALFALNRLLMRALFKVRARHTNRLPGAGRLLIAPNHASYLDPFVLAAALPRERLRDVYWAGWTGLLFRGPLTRLFSRSTQVVPVDAERGLTSTLAFGRVVLERDLALVWFPEGRRSEDGRLQRFLPGAGWLLERTGASVVPVWIEGAFEAWPPERRLPRRHPTSVTFGEPLTLEDLSAGGDERERHARIAERLREAVEALAPPGRAPG